MSQNNWLLSQQGFRFARKTVPVIARLAEAGLS